MRSLAITTASALLALFSTPLTHATHTKSAPARASSTIEQTLRGAGKYNTLLAALEASGLQAEKGARYTLLAPTDEAFADVPGEVLRKLLLPVNRDHLADILQLHLFEGELSASAAFARGRAHALNGDTVRFGLEYGRLRANGARLEQTDIECSNGVVHVIDRVLIPDDFDPSRLRERAKVLKFSANWKHPVHERGVVAERVEISVTGGGSVVLEDIEADVIVTRASGGGRITLSGVADRHEIRQSGGSVVSALELHTDRSTARISGGSTLEAWAAGSLDANASGGSTLRYRETSGSVQTHLSGYSSAVVVRNQVAGGGDHH